MGYYRGGRRSSRSNPFSHTCRRTRLNRRRTAGSHCIRWSPFDRIYATLKCDERQNGKITFFPCLLGAGSQPRPVSARWPSVCSYGHGGDGADGIRHYPFTWLIKSERQRALSPIRIQEGLYQICTVESNDTVKSEWEKRMTGGGKETGYRTRRCPMF